MNPVLLDGRNEIWNISKKIETEIAMVSISIFLFTYYSVPTSLIFIGKVGLA